MNSYWQQAADWFSGLKLRERYLISAAVLVALLMGGFSLAVEPAFKQHQGAQAATADAGKQLAQLQQQVTDLRQRLADDPTKRLQQQQQALQAERDELDMLLARATVDLIEPERMAAALQVALAHDSGADMVSLTTLAPEPVTMFAVADVQEPLSADATAAAAEPQPTLYRHPLQLVVRASYPQMRTLLANLEGQPWRFYWRSLDYRVEQFPHGELALELFTLSTSSDWLKGGG
ncbi:MAG: type II secretion system protein M [Gammaproteobacteria bacterium]|nr:type II secretion system protein M [Gammaproteobacteria bacterium]